MEIAKNVRIGIGIFFIIFIISFGLLTYNNRDKWFRNEVNITYTNGCKEQYVNGKIITDRCEQIPLDYTNDDLFKDLKFYND